MSLNDVDSNSFVVRLAGVNLRYGKKLALDNINLNIPSSRMIGLIGPDGVGKSSLMSLIAGSRAVQEGLVEVLGGSMAEAGHRNRVCSRIAYMPQGLGKNLYPTLSVEENLQFFGRLFGHDAPERRRRIDELTKSTGLYPFLPRPAGKLSGGMKQKLGLCCSLIHDPDLLVLDEPTTGVDPLSRSQFWDLIDNIRVDRPQMSVMVATAYMEEADRFHWLVAMDDGKILSTGTPTELRKQTGTDSLEAAFIALLPQEKRHGHKAVVVPPFVAGKEEQIAIEAQQLTMRFGEFTAVDHVNFRIQRGEIFGFLGSNGCGKSTTMKMLTGLLPATDGKALLFNNPVNAEDISIRRKVGYMSQAFSLYTELSVLQNLTLHAHLFNVPANEIKPRVEEMVNRFGLSDVLDVMPDSIPLGIRQRLSLAVAMVHKPELLILDEPTSGVDPIARDMFWQLMIDLSRNDKVTIFISTHFMNEAERCDRISLMHAGQVLISDRPAEIKHKRNTESLEEAFIAYLKDASGKNVPAQAQTAKAETAKEAEDAKVQAKRGFTLPPFFLRMFSYMHREALELKRDPVRGTLALVGSLVLMFIMGFGINMDVENLNFGALDHDQTTLSQDYILNIAGSRYFNERPPITDYEELDRRMRTGELSLALEIPPGFAADIKRGREVRIGAWIDGAMPSRAETIQSYVKGMHQLWLNGISKQYLGVEPAAHATMETRFRYNPDVKSLPAMVPAVIPLLLLMIPAMLTALSIVREKELGSIINLYVTPVTKIEFILGKLIPYIALGMFNFLLMTLLAVTIFAVPVKGSFLTLTLASFIFIIIATGMGLLASIFTTSQIAAIFLTTIGTMLPVMQFAGLLDPVSSLEGIGRFIGEIYPATHMIIISRGIFNKGLGLGDLYPSFLPLIAAVPVILLSSVLMLKKQET